MSISLGSLSPTPKAHLRFIGEVVVIVEGLETDLTPGA